MTFIVVRHAEKAADDPRDPTLNDAGQARAQRLVALLRDEALVAIYATQYRRTRQTATPLATARRLAVTGYDAARSADDFAAALREAHRSGTVLVVGHSNTVPGIVAALCGCTTEAMPESEYDRISRVRIGNDGRRTLHIERGAP
ncbi:SixA phosphatase family protein [Luteimonas aestuarii]|uniref:SixA phosphatase family protein n=1 Tax=Luteimonas aestuarii TaxID=453837 RepID=UPI00140432CF|nr:phosphoglycerate mutase family protein [Luteimonas aestuarii]